MSQSNFLDLVGSEDNRESDARGVNGVAVAIVTNNKDPEGLGRVKVHFPWLSDDHESDWVRVASFMAGGGRGGFFIPDVQDEVLVAFEHGDINRPIVIGSLWSVEDKSPEKNEDGRNNIKKIRTRSGNEIILDDSSGKERIEIHTKDGKGHKIILDNSTGASKVAIRDETDSNFIEIDSITGSISISSALDLSIKATTISLDALATINIRSPVIMVQAAGTITNMAPTINTLAAGQASVVSAGPLLLQGNPKI